MSFIIVEGERYALSIGDTVLGGTDDELLATSPLASKPSFAIVSVSPEGSSTIRRYPGGPSSLLDGQPLTEQPVELDHGARLEMPGTRVVFGLLRSSGRTAPVADAPDAASEDVIGEVVAQSTAATGGQLTAVKSGTVHEVGANGLSIGRDPASDVIIDHANISRLHARIEASLLGYNVIDSSTNGVFVNGKRVEETQRLNQGDVIRVGDVEFRFEADAASFEPDVSGVRPIPFVPPVAPPPAPKAPGKSAAGASDKRQKERTPLLATLEVLTEGALKGKRFRIERPVAHIGRGDYNDIELAEDSVSASHAMLIRRDDGWRITDLGSRNGTYVDGERTTDGPLKGPVDIRVGNVRMIFRPIAKGADNSDSTRGIVSVPD